LIEALWILDSQYRAISNEKTRLIQNKSRYSSSWFARRMGALDGYLKILRSEIGSAKTVGDGYAWIFYQDDDTLIDEHLKRQRQINLPPGVGGIGERAFVEKLQGLNRQFVLYHGITSYLRMGDVTFFDPATRRVRSIGELKSKQVGKDQYQITLGFVHSKDLEAPIDLASLQLQEGREGTDLPRSIATRLNKQLEEISGAIANVKEAASDKIHATQGTFYFKELDEVITESCTSGAAYRKAGKGLILGAIRANGDQASKRVFQKFNDLNNKLAWTTEAAQSIFDPSLNDNCICFGTVGYARDGFPIVLPGTIPLMWWPVLRKNLYDLIFGKVIVVSLYNPAHFWQMLRSKGYNVTTDGRSHLVSVVKTEGERRIDFRNIDYFRHLTTNFLMSDETVIDTLGQTLDEAQKYKANQRVKLTLKPRMKIDDSLP
jgi:hypothetical protein